ncbi:MAG TPA: YafY family protein, partial [Symbiobacteriaceae bacterium]|nr:YafY family protein [Symbiobacteriaceae bacterium]
RSRRRLTAAEIAESLEVSVRTAYRYIDALSASGVPIIADTGPEGGYSLPDNFRGAPLFFEPDELKALFQAARFARYAGSPHTVTLDAALDKLQKNLSPAQAEQLQRQVAALDAIPTGGATAPWLHSLEQAVAEGATLKLTYHKAAAEQPEERVVNPYGLVLYNGHWYLAAWCHLRQALRDFRVDRIQGLERTGGTFTRPPDFRIDQWFSDDWLIRSVNTGPFTTVRLSGTPAAIMGLSEHWYLRHCVTERKGTELSLRMDEYGMRRLPWFLLPSGTGVSILEPEHLRHAMSELIHNLAEHHKHP